MFSLGGVTLGLFFYGTLLSIFISLNPVMGLVGDCFCMLLRNLFILGKFIFCNVTLVMGLVSDDLLVGKFIFLCVPGNGLSFG